MCSKSPSQRYHLLVSSLTSLTSLRQEQSSTRSRLEAASLINAESSTRTSAEEVLIVIEANSPYAGILVI